MLLYNSYQHEPNTIFVISNTISVLWQINEEIILFTFYTKILSSTKYTQHIIPFQNFVALWTTKNHPFINCVKSFWTYIFLNKNCKLLDLMFLYKKSDQKVVYLHLIILFHVACFFQRMMNKFQALSDDNGILLGQYVQ